ncbi:SusC/RagA family TonB-linked outer membrane protein [Chitinophaga oryziterrae]|uniref:SusC/RagA family TonB-linked outer membrane protein n=1 Tax=Chitinophaga oryziterrae TaxID=1031224 RepID=A0A6N8JBM2_9BACT|nr:SusC/RagA family TonB-linked outer membrane protein [Chitinophaga oryziterrae]MVT41848.1 SusC/RagA family TonB-linked outer membrane protein [Chitinophaga oryziterrae]
MSKSTGNSSFRLWSGILLLFVFTAASLYAQGKPPAEKLVSLNVKNETLKVIFDKITEQTSLYFTGSADQLDRNFRTSITVTNEPLNSVLAKLLKGKGVSWLIGEKTITIVKGEGGNHISISNQYPNPVFNDSLITVRGKIIDEKGQPIPGATIIVSGTKLGTISHNDGSFIMKDVERDATLSISSVSFVTQDIFIHGQEILKPVALKSLVETLDETVIIAYGTTTQRFSTGNVSVVKGAEIERQPVSNPLLALAGRVPGVFITQSSGIAGGGVKILIQGQNSISKGNEPFYVIDGVPYTSQLLPSINGDLLGYSGVTNPVAGNPLNYIDPSDIESISILKDADATAIYGSRAANGAILITTKKGKTGQVKLDANLQQGWGKVGRTIKLLNTKEYLTMRNEAIKNSNRTVGPTDYDINGFWDTTRQTNWQKELIGKTSKYSNANVSISGGTNLAQYMIGGTYRKETSVFPGEFADQKAAFHCNLNSTSNNQKFNLQFTGNYLADINKLPISDLTGRSILLAPNAPALYNSDGSLNWMLNNAGNSTWSNPLASSYIEYSNKTNNLISNLLLNYKIFSGFELRTSMGYTNLVANEIYTAPMASQSPEAQPTFPRTAQYGNNSINSWIIEPQASYKRGLGMGKLEALIGTTIQQSNNRSLQQYGSGYSSDQVLKDLQSASSITVSSSIASIYKYNALFSRINYILRDRYVINLNARRDGSSRFGIENQFHNFGSVAAAWIFSQETLIKSKRYLLSYGKIRASYGTTGNDQINDYQFLNLYIPYSVGVTYQGINSIVPQGLTNPYLQWEETRKLQFGLDLGWLKDRILLNINYSKNRSSNQLLQYNLPILTGFSNIARNFPAKVENNAWEFAVNAKIFDNHVFNWESNFNLTVANNKLLDFPNLATSSYAQSLVIGQPINIVKLYQSAGVNSTTGIYQFFDSKGVITSSPNSRTDMNYIISRFPKFYGGFQNVVSYKGIEISFLLQFVKQTALGNYIGSNPGNTNKNQPISVLERWQKTGDVTQIQKYSTNSDFSAFFGTFYARQSNLSFTDASYIRLKNLSFTWKFPSSWSRRLQLQNARIYFQGQNLLTFTKYKGFDPETASYGNLPPLRVLTFGIQVSL